MGKRQHQKGTHHTMREHYPSTESSCCITTHVCMYTHVHMYTQARAHAHVLGEHCFSRECKHPSNYTHGGWKVMEHCPKIESRSSIHHYTSGFQGVFTVSCQVKDLNTLTIHAWANGSDLEFPFHSYYLPLLFSASRLSLASSMPFHTPFGLY